VKTLMEHGDAKGQCRSIWFRTSPQSVWTGG